MTEPTQGPWLAAAKPSSIVGWPIVAPKAGGRLICNVNYVQKSDIDPGVPGDRAFNDESRANARLIAAAWEMLEALKDVRERARRIRENEAIVKIEARFIERVVDEALARVKGEQP